MARQTIANAGWADANSLADYFSWGTRSGADAHWAITTSDGNSHTGQIVQVTSEFLVVSLEVTMEGEQKIMTAHMIPFLGITSVRFSAETK
jgi:hypothetical protein